MTTQEVAKLVSVLFASFPSAIRHLAPQDASSTIGIYQRMLADLEYETANAAIANIIACGKFLPTIAEIREECLKITCGPQISGAEGWGEVRAAIGKHGAYKTPGVDFEFQDATVAVVVKWLGWRELCLSENEIADRARFVEAYDKQATVARKRAQAPDSLPAIRRFLELKAVRDSMEVLDGGKA